MRAAVAGLSLLARTGYPVSVFATIAEATRWLASHTGASPDTVAADTRDIEAFIQRS